MTARKINEQLRLRKKRLERAGLLPHNETWLEFYNRTNGTEKIVNPEFTAWTTNNPDGWTVPSESHDEVDPEFYISEHNGKAKFVATDIGVASMHQADIFAADKEYSVIVDVRTITEDGEFRVYCGALLTQITVPGYYVFDVSGQTGNFQIRTEGPCEVVVAKASVTEF